MGGALGSAEVRAVLSRGKLEMNGFNTFERAHDNLSRGVFKNYFCALHGGVPNRRTAARPRHDFLSNFSRSCFGKNFLGMFWGSFNGVKTYSEQNRIMGQDF